MCIERRGIDCVATVPVMWVHLLNPTVADCLRHAAAGKCQPSPVEKSEELVRAGDPNQYRRCVGHIPETLLAFANRGFGPLALRYVMNRSNQMGTNAFVVMNRRDSDFTDQPPGREIRCFFPLHGGILLNRLPVVS